MPSLPREAYPPHLLAQKLNNRGATLIETGRFDEAITTLVKALKLSEQSSNDKACCCRFCSLDACLSASDTGPLMMQQQDSQSLMYKVNSSSHCIECSKDEATSSDETSSENQGGFVYSKPVRVDAKSINDGHNMGSTLSLITIFNLALAHHLNATAQTMSSSSTPPNLPMLEKSLRLYEFAYQVHLDDDDECTQNDKVGSLRFNMIVSNNLGEIYRVAGCRTKHEMCLQHLLQTIMYLVVSQVAIDSVELDGFFRNASQIMQSDICARAA